MDLFFRVFLLLLLAEIYKSIRQYQVKEHHHPQQGLLSLYYPFHFQAARAVSAGATVMILGAVGMTPLRYTHLDLNPTYNSSLNQGNYSANLECTLNNCGLSASPRRRSCFRRCCQNNSWHNHFLSNSGRSCFHNNNWHSLLRYNSGRSQYQSKRRHTFPPGSLGRSPSKNTQWHIDNPYNFGRNCYRCNARHNAYL